jgi:hypothetical protein
MSRAASSLVGLGSILAVAPFFVLPYLLITLIATEGVPPRERGYSGWDLAAWDALGHGAPNPLPTPAILWLIPSCSVLASALVFAFLRRPVSGAPIGIIVLGLGVVIPQVYFLVARNQQGDGFLSALGSGYWLIWIGAFAIGIGGVILTRYRWRSQQRAAG